MTAAIQAGQKDYGEGTGEYTCLIGGQNVYTQIIMQPECRQHPTAQPEGLSKDYSARYSRGMLSLSNYGPYKPCNPWHLSAGLVMVDRTWDHLGPYEPPGQEDGV